jgi:TPP-dependent indolepyruvate ferredoxin oxidoreductase alpha subunit
MALAAVSLDDKYELESGRVFLTGTQALVRLPMMQRQRDLAAGLNTAGFISGYRGSPLGGYDQTLWRASKFLKRHHISFTAGLNEEIAATRSSTAIWPGPAAMAACWRCWATITTQNRPPCRISPSTRWPRR